MRYDERPVDDTPVHTDEVPPTPICDRNIPATAWVEAPDSLLTLGDDLPDQPVADYKRRIGPSGTRHAKFRAWKEDLRDT